MSTAVQTNVSSYMYTQVIKNGKKKGKKKKKQKSTPISMTKSASTGRISSNHSNGLTSLSRSNTSENLKLPSISKEYPLSPRLTTPMRMPPALNREILPTACDRRKKMPLLNAIKPENEKSEKERFFRANYNYNPYFIYRFPAPPEVLERISTPSDKLLNIAILIMEIAIDRYGSYEEFENQTGGPVLGRSQIITLVKNYVKRENLENEIMLNLSEDLLSRGSMTRVKGKPTLNVRIVNLRQFWVEGLLRHEIGTHYLRSMNNKFQPWSNWKVRTELGMAPMNPTEEGLASLHSVLLRKDPCLWRCALLYYTVYKAAHLSLKELFIDLGKFVNDPQVRWDYCIRAKRGQADTSRPGAFCKDQVYLDGALQILKNRRHLDFHSLLRYGKISYRDIDIISDIAELEYTRIPSFMEDLHAYRGHLDRICDANGLTDDILMKV
ncbi:putative tyrosine carboxypeptidase MATCAP2 [Mytilus galloprovincialis]|uniref:putative tyrosine carboxypeptidase MATCAP2 n=1 Tax=Mytilus galloprovincialis TaxID=29158 RepID=UPI003F7B9B63